MLTKYDEHFQRLFGWESYSHWYGLDGDTERLVFTLVYLQADSVVCAMTLFS